MDIQELNRKLGFDCKNDKEGRIDGLNSPNAEKHNGIRLNPKNIELMFF